MSLTSCAVAEIATADERDYDVWLTTLSQATERLDELQTAVAELRQLCAQGDVMQSRQVMEVLEKHRAAT